MFDKKKTEKLKQMVALNEIPGNGPISVAAKSDKRAKIIAMVYPPGGGDPYEEEVSIEENGTFTLKKTNLTYHVSPGSCVRCIDGKRRTVVRQDNTETVNVALLNGDNVMHPIVFNGVANNNYWRQWQDWVRRQAQWKSATTWGLMALGVCGVLLVLWQIKTIGGGLEGVQDALHNLRAGSTPTAPTTPAQQAGHNAIAPGA